MIRIDPASNAEVARVPVGNGPAGFAFDGSFVWILNHRENTLDRIDPVTNQVVRKATIPGGERVAAERIAVFDGLLWITGRGLDLAARVADEWIGGRARPRSAPAGSTSSPTGPACGPSRTGRKPIRAASRSSTRCCGSMRLAESRPSSSPTRALHADGVAAANGQLWLFDAVAGLVVRLPA